MQEALASLVEKLPLPDGPECLFLKLVTGKDFVLGH